MEIIAPLATVVARAPLAVAGLAAAMELAVGPMREIAIAGDAGDARTRALLEVAQRRFDPLTRARLGTVRRRARCSTDATPVDGVARRLRVPRVRLRGAGDRRCPTLRARARGPRLKGQN